MAGRAEQDRILAEAAKEVLLPLGLMRKGKSRTYLSDEGIWSCVVEFQPSGFSKGSSLNVAAHWLWTTNEHISFDFSFGFAGRVGHDFIQFRTPEQFAEDSRRLSRQAVEPVRKLRSTFRSIHDIARVLVEVERENARSGRGGCWGAFNGAVACGLAGDAATARALFLSVANGDVSSDWKLVRRADALRLAELTGDTGRFREAIMTRVAATRARLRMPGQASPAF